MRQFLRDQVVIATRAVTTLAGTGSNAYADGTGVGVGFGALHNLAVSPDGATIYVPDDGNRRIRQVCRLAT